MEKLSGTKSVFFRFYILCENFSKIGPIVKKILKFPDDPLKSKYYRIILNFRLLNEKLMSSNLVYPSLFLLPMKVKKK